MPTQMDTVTGVKSLKMPSPVTDEKQMLKLQKDIVNR
jgi:hypothetical protein